MGKTLKAGIIGAGYIADWHADALRATPGAELTAVCDLSAPAAERLAARHGARAFCDVAGMLAEGGCDIVHVTTPPGSHKDIAVQCLRAGCHVLVEKPVALNAADVAEINAAAEAAGRAFVPGHNFLGIPAYGRLKSLLDEGALGRVGAAELSWAFPLAPLRSGPYGLWMLREPGNLLRELGPHLFAFAHDLFGPLEIAHLSLGKPVALPGAGARPQSWRITARAGAVDVTIALHLVEVMDDRSLTLRGSSAMARLDYAADVLTISRENTSDLVLNPLRRQLGDAWQHLREGTANATRQLVSLNRKSPYALSFQGLFAQVYGALGAGQPVPERFSGRAAEAVTASIDSCIDMIPRRWTPPAAKRPRRKPKPDVMVIGGTGFIGRALTRGLVEKGHDVRVISRGAHGPFADIADRVETRAVSLYDQDALGAAMEGIDCVFNLARSLEETWQAALEHDVAPALNVARAVQAAGVRRLVYTGTIASYDMSDPARVIREDTPFADDMTDRNIYARSKAECECRLLEMHREAGLPVVIARPGIVVGAGGPLQHWGIGRWHGAGAVRLWGDGRHNLPFVLIDDVVSGLIATMEVPGIEGQGFNLVGAPMLTGRGYFEALHERLGAKLRVRSGNLHAYWAADAVKFALKRHALRRSGAVRASLRDWKSRAHFSQFDIRGTCETLRWQPVSDRETFLRKAIDEANLIGF